jgi:hypothetical protein
LVFQGPPASCIPAASDREIEKAWRNTDVEKTRRKVRASDKGKTVQSDPMYGISRDSPKCLDEEGQSYKGMDKQQRTMRATVL